MKKFRIYFGKIEEVEIERETEKFYFIKGRRCEKGGWAGDVHDTWVQARDVMIKRSEEIIVSLKRGISREEEYLTKIKELMP
jgi:hypothetical protein